MIFSSRLIPGLIVVFLSSDWRGKLMIVIYLEWFVRLSSWDWKETSESVKSIIIVVDNELFCIHKYNVNMHENTGREREREKKASNDQGLIYRLILLPYCRTRVSKVILGFAFFPRQFHCLDRRQKNVIVGFDLIKLGRLMQLIRSTSATCAHSWSSGCNSSFFFFKPTQKRQREKENQMWGSGVELSNASIECVERWHQV